MSTARAVAALLLVAASCSNSSASTAETSGVTTASGTATIAPDSVDTSVTATTAPAIPMPVFDAGLLPAIPAPTTLVGVDPASQATELVAATSDDLTDVGPGWLAVYSALAVPVIDQAGVSTIADDALGPRWDAVWSLGDLSRGSATVPFADLGPMLGAEPATPIDPAVLLADLRSAVVSTDPRVQTFGLFVTAKAVANGGASLLDPTTTVDQLPMDVATVQLISWVITRDTLPASLAEDMAAYAPPSGFVNSRARRAGAAPCSEALGTADETSWINWVANKVGGGVGAEGVGSTPGVIEALITQMKKASQGVDAAKAAGAKAAKFVNRLNIIVSALSLAAQINSMSVATTMNPDPLIRKRETSDGNTAKVGVTLSFDASTLDSNNPTICALSMVANALGVGLSLPANGAKLANVELIVTSGQNFGSKVYFGANADRKRVTDSGGFVEIEVQGKARRNAVPPSAPEKKDEFGLNFAAQVEELTAQSLLNVFVDGLSMAGGAMSGVIDIAKSLHYDLGEFAYNFTDYDQGYKVTTSSFWDFPDSGLGLTATFVDAELLPTGQGTYSGTVDVTWGVAGTIGAPGCGLVQGIDPGKATLTGTKDGGGSIKITIEYTASTIHNVSTCGPVSREGTINVTAGTLSIVGDEAETLDDSLPQVVFSGPQTQEGTAQYTVVPAGD